MNYTPETLSIFIQAQILLEGIRSPLGTRYINQKRNRQNFIQAFTYLDGTEQLKEAERLAPLINQQLGELNDLRTGEKHIIQNRHHSPDDSLNVIVQGRRDIAQLIREVRNLRK